jgi:hypothetical protein
MMYWIAIGLALLVAYGLIVWEDRINNEGE